MASGVPELRVELLNGLRQGTRLPRLLRRLVSRSAASTRDAVALIRGAPIVLSPSDLTALLHNPYADINDLPPAGGGRLVWYAWNAEVVHALRGISSEDERRRLGGYVSKHAVELEAAGGYSASVTLSAILDWSQATGAAVPSRASSVQQVSRAIDQWHLKLWNTVHIDPALPFPPAPTQQASVPDVIATPIMTVGRLTEEGRRMRHCVGFFAKAALRGERAYFHGQAAGEHVTIAVARRAGGWYLVEAQAFANRPPKAMEAIREWVATLV